MGKVYEQLDDRLADFIGQQHLFFVATAPQSDDGRINLSPRGLDTFRILDEHTVAFLDLTGSGAETIAHLRENGRITLMFCALAGPPKVVRLQGRGEVFTPGDREFEDFVQTAAVTAGARALIRIRCERISDSCGFGVSLYQYQGERPQLIDWCDRKGPDGLVEYQRKHNKQSIDGLPALEVD